MYSPMPKHGIDQLCVLGTSGVRLGHKHYSTGARNLKNEIVQHILQKRFDLTRW